MWQGTVAPDTAGELLGNAVISGKSQTCFLSVVPRIKMFGLGDEITVAEEIPMRKESLFMLNALEK